MDYNFQEIIDNRKESSRRRYLDKLLSECLDGGYNKNNIKPERFISIEKIQSVINQSANYCSNITELEKELGSTLHLLIEPLIKEIE